MTKKNILILKGGGKEEHDISLITADYIKDQIPSEFNTVEVTVEKDHKWYLDGKVSTLNFEGQLTNSESKVSIDLVIPCFHGYPGETGHIQSYLEMINIPFLGCSAESSFICFNKVLTKLWLEKIGVPITPFIILNNKDDKQKERLEFFDKHQAVFIKASNQGSSVGCYPVKNKTELNSKISEAFKFSNFVLIEKLIRPKELEISVYDYKQEIKASWPSEIDCPDKFYSYDEKYSQDSATKTILKADIPQDKVLEIQKHATAAFKALNLEQFCRMDFFLCDDQIYLNEINTFPGMTPISMFPKMIEADGQSFKEFIEYHLKKSLK